jgi:glutamate racemase
VDGGWNELIASLRTDVWTVADNGNICVEEDSGRKSDERVQWKSRWPHILTESEIAFTVIACNTLIQVLSI